MAFLQNILSQLMDMEIAGQGQEWMDLANINPADISGHLQTYYGISEENLPPHLFQGISSDILKQGLGKTYSPQIEAGSSTLLDTLQQTLGGQEGRLAMGGFAGSGQASKFQQGATDVYGKGMSDVITKAGVQRSQGLQSVQDIINQWKDTAMGIQYG